MTTRRIWMALAIALLIPAQARAQAAAISTFGNTAPTFGDLTGILKVGDWVKVTDEKGTTRNAKVTDVSAASLGLVEKETQWRFTATDQTVTQVQRTDRLWDGALIGLAPGAVGLAAAALGAQAASDFLGLHIFLAFVGPGIGALVDRLIGNEVIYRARSGAGQAKLVVAPLLSRHGAGVSLSLGF